MRCGTMPFNYHFRDCKALLVTSLTHVSGAIALYLSNSAISGNKKEHVLRPEDSDADDDTDAVSSSSVRILSALSRKNANIPDISSISLLINFSLKVL